MAINNENHGFTVWAIVVFIVFFSVNMVHITFLRDLEGALISFVLGIVILVPVLYVIEKYTRFNVLSWSKKKG